MNMIQRLPSLRSRLTAVALIALLVGCASGPTEVVAPPLKTVGRVDLERYLGIWHEVARYPFGIQDRRCARDTTATYRLLTSRAIGVTNRCTQADGSVFSVDGEAWILDAATNAKLEVSFLPAWLRSLPVGRGDYWVIELDADYRWVVIGEPRRRYLWILARSPTLSADDFAGIVGRLPAYGYDPSRLVRSPGR